MKKVIMTLFSRRQKILQQGGGNFCGGGFLALISFRKSYMFTQKRNNEVSMRKKWAVLNHKNFFSKGKIDFQYFKTRKFSEARFAHHQEKKSWAILEEFLQ